MSDSRDVVVIGGGPAGSAAAQLLAADGWSVLLLERKTFPRRKVCGEYLSATNLPLLERLGVGEAFRERAGPEVRRVGLFAGETVLEAPLPVCGSAWGRAMGRDQLDGLLLARAAAAGAEVRQPCSLIGLQREGERFRGMTDDGSTFTARVAVAAHGSWELGPLPTQPKKTTPRPGDLFGFKAHFQDSSLADGLMPLLSFPGGYGGMVHTDGGRVSLSLCIRRDVLASLRGEPASAGDCVEAHLRQHCRGVRQALAGARRDGPWLAAGPIRPGERLRQPAGIFPLGNVAGEAHPVIAEGISIALQSAWLLTGVLRDWRRQNAHPAALAAAGRSYARLWRRHFNPRRRAALLIAHWAMRPALVTASLPLLRCFPTVLTWGARASGKTWRVLPAGT